MPNTPRMEAMVLEVTFDPTTGVLKLKDFENKVEQTATKSKAALSGIGEGARTLTAALGTIGIGVGLYQLGSFLADSYREFANAQQGAVRFASAVKAAGGDIGATTRRAEEFAKQLAQITVFDDDAILASEKLLYAIGGLRGEGLERATKAAADLASMLSGDGEQMSIGQAAQLLAKAAAGSTAALQRYGIVIAETIPEGERFAAVLDAIARKAGGSAEADAQTVAGSMAQAENRTRDLKEAFGRLIDTMGGGTSQISGWTKLMQDLADAVDRLAGSDFLTLLFNARGYSTAIAIRNELAGLQMPGMPPPPAPARNQTLYGPEEAPPGYVPTRAALGSGFKNPAAQGGPYGPASPYDLATVGGTLYSPQAMAALNAETSTFLSLIGQITPGQADAGIRALYDAALPLALMLDTQLNPELQNLRDALGYGEDVGTMGNAAGANTGFGGVGAGYGGILDVLQQFPTVASDATAALQPLSQGVQMIAQGFSQAGAAFLDAAIHGESTSGIFSGIARQLGRSAMAQGLYELALGVAALTPWGRALYGDPTNHFTAAAYFTAAGAALSAISGGGGSATGAAGGGGYGTPAGSGSKFGPGYAASTAGTTPASGPVYGLTVIVEGSVISEAELARIITEQQRRQQGRRGL